MASEAPSSQPHRPQTAQQSALKFTQCICYVLYGTVQFGTVRYRMVRYSMVRYGTVQFGTVQYGTVLYGKVRYGTVRCGAVRYNMVSPSPPNSEGPPKSCQTQTDCENC